MGAHVSTTRSLSLVSRAIYEKSCFILFHVMAQHVQFTAPPHLLEDSNSHNDRITAAGGQWSGSRPDSSSRKLTNTINYSSPPGCFAWRRVDIKTARASEVQALIPRQPYVQPYPMKYDTDDPLEAILKNFPSTFNYAAFFYTRLRIKVDLRLKIGIFGLHGMSQSSNSVFLTNF